MYQIVNQESNSLEILLYSLISRGQTAHQIINAVKQSKAEHITLRINSDGGEVFESIALYNFLKDKDVHVIIDGLCASGASIAAMAGKTITMLQGSMMMIHNPLTIAFGYAEDLRAEAEILDKISDSIAGIYASRTGKEKSEVLDLMKAETWLQDYEALAEGFADEIDAPASEEDIKEEEDHPESRPVEENALYREGVQAERARLQELDELYAPGREAILNRAKYETYAHAGDVAIEILKTERKAARPSAEDNVRVNNLPLPNRDDEAIKSMAEIISSMRM